MLKRLNFTYHKPKIVPGKADTAKQKAWLRYYRWLRKIKCKTAVFLFGDACHPQGNGEASYGWIYKGEEKQLKSNSGRQHLNLNGVVDIDTMEITMTMPPTVNAQAMIELGKELLKKYPLAETIYWMVYRSDCSKNMQRLAWAIQLYRLEHGKLPDENWAEQIEKYLGESPERYFSCPSNISPKGAVPKEETTYALVRYSDKDDATADTVGGSLDTILLVELTAPVAFDKASVSVDDVLELVRQDNIPRGQRRVYPHVGGMNVAYRSGAVRYLSSSIDVDELRRMLGLAEP